MFKNLKGFIQYGTKLKKNLKDDVDYAIYKLIICSLYKKLHQVLLTKPMSNTSNYK